MLLIKIKKTKKRFRAYPTYQAVQTKGSTALNQISGLLRHSNVAVTKKHYAELEIGVLKKAVDKLGAMK